MPPTLAIILKGYPRLSETFIAEEIHALEKSALNLTLISLRHPTDRKTHPIHRAIRAPITYLPEYLHREPLRVLRAWQKIRRTPNYRAARKIYLRDLRHEPPQNWRNRIRRFGQALVLAAELPPQTTLLYAHFLHTPASVARYASHLRAIPWSCSAHAKDIWTLPTWEKREKLSDCLWLTTCTRANYQHLRALAPHPQRIHLNYHGVSLTRFPAPRPTTSPNNHNASTPTHPVQILSIGRAVRKKGYHALLNALATLPPDLHWRFTHIGNGPLLPALRQHAKKLNLAPRIHWLGAQTQTRVLHHYRRADLFVLNSCITPDGDRDGLPNVLLEAQTQSLPVLATNLSGIPELIQHNKTGILVPPEKPAALSQALQTLITNPKLRHRLGEAARTRVTQKFDQAKTFLALHKLATTTPRK